jgi:hypothetical protein
MALQFVPGAEATVTVGSDNIVFSQVSLSHGDDLLPIMYFNNSYREAITGLKSLSGELAGPLSYNAAGTSPFDLSGTSATLVITFATGCSISCTVVFGALRTGVDVAGIGTLSIGFEKAAGSSDPTIAWDESAS